MIFCLLICIIIRLLISYILLHRELSDVLHATMAKDADTRHVVVHLGGGGEDGEGMALVLSDDDVRSPGLLSADAKKA